MLILHFYELFVLSIVFSLQIQNSYGYFVFPRRQASTLRLNLYNNEVPMDYHDKISKRVLICVEPTPFNYISGYANRFQETLKYFKKFGDNASIITADSDPNPPENFIGFPISTQRGFSLPMYKQVTCTFDFARRIPQIIEKFKPSVIHVSTPSAIVFPATFWAKRYGLPLVMSYHTDLVAYVKAYLPVPGLTKLAEFLLKFFFSRANLVLCTSPQVRDQIKALGINHVDVWQKGINTDIFCPKYRDSKMREYLSQGSPESPLLLYVGRIGTEKKLERLKAVLDKNPTARLAFVGAGPAEEKLRTVFDGYPVFFAGQMKGEQLSRAFASADVFVMPSDSETLGFVVMEALASGVPVVGVQAGGLIDIIESGKTGFLAENDDDMTEFSGKVAHLIAHADERKQMGDAAVDWAKKWSWEAATFKLTNEQYSRALELHKISQSI